MKFKGVYFKNKLTQSRTNIVICIHMGRSEREIYEYKSKYQTTGEEER